MLGRNFSADSQTLTPTEPNPVSPVWVGLPVSNAARGSGSRADAGAVPPNLSHPAHRDGSALHLLSDAAGRSSMQRGAGEAAAAVVTSANLPVSTDQRQPELDKMSKQLAAEIQARKKAEMFLGAEREGRARAEKALAEERRKVAALAPQVQELTRRLADLNRANKVMRSQLQIQQDAGQQGSEMASNPSIAQSMATLNKAYQEEAAARQQMEADLTLERKRTAKLKARVAVLEARNDGQSPLSGDSAGAGPTLQPWSPPQPESDAAKLISELRLLLERAEQENKRLQSQRNDFMYKVEETGKRLAAAEWEVSEAKRSAGLQRETVAGGRGRADARNVDEMARTLLRLERDLVEARRELLGSRTRLEAAEMREKELFDRVRERDGAWETRSTWLEQQLAHERMLHHPPHQQNTPCWWPG